MLHNDFFYYKKWNFSKLFDKYDGTRGHVVFKPWEGGFNNIRMSLELAVCFAYLTNRTLVLPPKYNMYLLKDTFGLENFFDVQDLGISYISFKEFCKNHNIEETYEAVETVCVISKPHENELLNFTNIVPEQNIVRNRKLSDMYGLSRCASNVYFDKCLLGNFYMRIYSPELSELKKVIARHVHYLPEIFDMTSPAIKLLGDKNYYAIHIRRNDFQYKHLFITPEEILQNIQNIIPEKSNLYIATDHRDENFFTLFKQRYNVFLYKDIEDSLRLLPHYNYIPIIEQLICTRAIKFIGNDFSTLSSYIYRMRGYMNDIEDKNYYINTKPFDEKHQISFSDNEIFNGNWTREFRDGWEF